MQDNQRSKIDKKKSILDKKREFEVFLSYMKTLCINKRAQELTQLQTTNKETTNVCDIYIYSQLKDNSHVFLLLQPTFISTISNEIFGW